MLDCRAPIGARVTSKYEPLQRFLLSRLEEQISLSFEAIEEILGFRLPQSARRYAPWWANVGRTHVQASAWLGAGWKTSRVDVPGAKVVFVRVCREPALSVGETGRSYLHSDLEEDVAVRLSALSPMAMALVRRRAGECAISAEEAIADLLHEAAVDRRRRLLDRFPLVGEPSLIDSVDLIREDRDER
jgi:hypothetical protein